VTFLWITTTEPSCVTSVEEDHHSLRSGSVLKNHSYESRKIPLEAANKTIWDRYKSALEAKERQDQNELPTLEDLELAAAEENIEENLEHGMADVEKEGDTIKEPITEA
jgi:hypothetical protein